MTDAWKGIVSQAGDLVTPRNKTREGFVMLIGEKNRLAIPYIKEARDLLELIKTLKKPSEAWDVEDARSALLSAAGMSQKAMKNLPAESYADIYQQFSREFLEPEGDFFVEEIMYRFLLSKGDTLGGSMRNVVGRLGKRRLNQFILESLKGASIKEYDMHPNHKSGLEEKIKDFSWKNSKGDRVFTQDIHLNISHTNVDMCLFAATYEQRQEASKNPQSYLALGELKSGFDPAGADEHWKTARSALARLRDSIDPSPPLFFIGAAIENSMADEIFEQLNKGEISFASNLTNDEQMRAFCQWLISL